VETGGWRAGGRKGSPVGEGVPHSWSTGPSVLRDTLVVECSGEHQPTRGGLVEKTDHAKSRKRLSISEYNIASNRQSKSVRCRVSASAAHRETSVFRCSNEHAIYMKFSYRNTRHPPPFLCSSPHHHQTCLQQGDCETTRLQQDETAHVVEQSQEGGCMPSAWAHCTVTRAQALHLGGQRRRRISLSALRRLAPQLSGDVSRPARARSFKLSHVGQLL